MKITKVLFGDDLYKMVQTEDEVTFIWAGGPYIDMIVKSSNGVGWMIDGSLWNWSDQNINVWDYETGSPEFDWDDDESLIRTIEEWMSS